MTGISPNPSLLKRGVKGFVYVCGSVATRGVEILPNPPLQKEGVDSHLHDHPILQKVEIDTHSHDCIHFIHPNHLLQKERAVTSPFEKGGLRGIRGAL